MFDKIIAYSIRHKLIVGVMVISLIITGLYSMRHLPIDALPDITNNQVQIITSSPSLATQEVELYITYPIELAVKSIPDIVELRSISRFGLSLVTIVFEENVDIYWARNQINERLKKAEEKIPEGFGTPELAPISTGLGEIFQYTVEAKLGHEDEYDLMSLRSIQDWLIIPQILGTEGVAEVNTLGGLLKEYEVSVDPDKLKSKQITMVEIFNALERNNENTGGAYIDKKPYAYFIRSVGMVSSLDDISKIVVKVQNGVPILIRDIAKVQYGSAVRYGATTRNGTGEVINGMVMMLKGENSAEIVALVKEKFAQIEKTLPSGVEINPYLDRSRLVNRAISTVRKNLIEGALIVIFILVLLIGNIRAGLIVASVIPLSLLFAVTMMHLFGISGNLMSLGAIDFGLIVDGAVIIVEAIIHRLYFFPAKTKLTAEEMDQEVYQAASEIRSSAAFGEIIILIVYLPILALVGIEGKMFTPMAQTVAFAILGAFILSLSYVPMMCALLLKNTIIKEPNFSDKIIAVFHRLYRPLLNFALRFKLPIITTTVLLFLFALWLFSQLGGEFIPNLEEGDIATHIIIPPGSSLEQEIQTTTKAERLIIENFPEVLQVVSKIGSAEIPTDPMPMEVADMLIILKDKSEWTSASSKEELFKKMGSVLDQLPGVTSEFSQPIQMRFNELMTGIRSDVGIKIFGENIDRLVAIGEKVENIVNTIEGTTDVRAETVSGLPQINIIYNKDKLALYGLNVSDLNQMVSMGFAGSTAGVVYDGEKKYNLVVRLDESHRKDISNLENLYVNLPSGNQIPLDQVADIKIEMGPAQISREAGKRRIVVGFNVGDRDVESVVYDIKNAFDEQLNLPVGYYLEYAGQFENLNRAKERLMIAVPIALALIFILLYFTFQSIIQTILIFTAIPLSAIGGIFALYLRGMPFSISAGIGFIALFGVAVLNGIVLIGYLNTLKEKGYLDVIARIKEATKVRLRPVIMTAAVASFGFLPMALSTSAGAEVQKPLATVVIGGLITATFLTLIVLPILYYYTEKWTNKSNPLKKTLLLIIMLGAGASINAQRVVNDVDEAITIAMENNGHIKAAKLGIQRANDLKKGAYNVPMTEISANLGQLNRESFDQAYSISQSFNPFAIGTSKKLYQASVAIANVDYHLTQELLKKDIRLVWDEYKYTLNELVLVEKQLEIWKEFQQRATISFELGETGLLEKLTATSNLEEATLEARRLKMFLENLELKLSSLLSRPIRIILQDSTYQPFSKVNLNNDNNRDNLWLSRYDSETQEKVADIELAKSTRKPSFKVGYGIQSSNLDEFIDGEYIYHGTKLRFHQVEFGVEIPIFGNSRKSIIASKKTEKLIIDANRLQKEQEIEEMCQSMNQNLELQQQKLQYYEDYAVNLAQTIFKAANESYELGEIGYVEYVQALEKQYKIQSSFLEAIHDWNQNIIQTQFLLAQ